MNPFDLHGPEFLQFYIVLAAFVAIALAFHRRRYEAGPAPKIEFDPYSIAFLRGGKNEALRVGVVSLIDRGLLAVKGEKVAQTAQARSVTATPHERALLDHFSRERKATDVFKDGRLDETCRPFAENLQEHGLLPDETAKKRRWTATMLALLLLLGVSGIKLAVALQRGKHNVIFLIVVTVIAVVVAWRVGNPRVTLRGKAFLEDLRLLYRGLKDRASSVHSGGATAEALMLAAVFGLAALPVASFAYSRSLFPKAQSSTSGCGTSCGSSCGSSCGGGGCGGGCGGCGG